MLPLHCQFKDIPYLCIIISFLRNRAMSIFSKLFKKKEAETTEKVGGIEDFMTLIRVYYQSVMASNLGITNAGFLPDMAVFKRTLKIPTQNNKLGVAEKSRCKSCRNRTQRFSKSGQQCSSLPRHF